MPTEPNGPTERVPRTPRSSRLRRVTVVPGGPVLVEGPVEVRLADGTTVVSDRFQVAVCACRRSGSYPFCDASHRRKRR
ncbi:CDGSH iron-sulfur domain-containing protein [Saccharomonospora glauca]|uniref:Iron-binding zinc finger protein, CDGSH type n=1 Tax=Saccharomonospora glauca K62 TaxID=928724 RepID=I1CZR3_9PSEU|nr:CDGSH iron-sulfur domain-containing protein [Saccharomonospora glauca]EIE98187.1 iron-binding zinc finger protein, CDGSH type [Saccharomonospora glauca K62]